MTSSASLNSRWPHKLALGGIFLLAALGPSLCALAPRAMAMLLVVAGLCAVPLALSVSRSFPSRFMLFGGGAGVGFLALAAWRSPAGEAAHEAALYLVVAVALTALLRHAVAAVESEKLGRFPVWLLLGTLSGAVLMAIEWLFGMPLHRALSVVNGDPVPPLYALDRTLVLLSLLFWPLAGAVLTHWSRHIGVVLLGAVAAIALLTLTSSQSALIGLVIGLMTFVGVRIFPQFALATLRIAVQAGFLLAPFMIVGATWLLGIAADQSTTGFWHHANAGERLAIWRHTVVVILDQPWWGHGVEALRADPFYEQLKHCHNGPLQIWAEFGLLGALVACGAARALFVRMAQLPLSLRPAAVGCFMAWLVVFCVGYSIWQPWWIATGLLIIVHFTILAQLTNRPAVTRS